MSKATEAAKNISISEMGKARPGTLELVFDRKVKIDDIHKAIKVAVGWHGCTACGLNGLDLRFRVQDPVFEVFNEIEALRDINVYR